MHCCRRISDGCITARIHPPPPLPSSPFTHTIPSSKLIRSNSSAPPNVRRAAECNCSDYYACARRMLARIRQKRSLAARSQHTNTNHISRQLNWMALVGRNVRTRARWMRAQLGADLVVPPCCDIAWRPMDIGGYASDDAPTYFQAWNGVVHKSTRDKKSILLWDEK